MTREPIPPMFRGLHWAIAGLFVLAVGAILLRGQLPSGHPWRPWLKGAHLAAGQVVLLLALLRVQQRWFSSGRWLSAPGARFKRMAASGVHLALYGVMLVQPLSGLVFMQSGGQTVTFMGWPLPTLLDEDKALHIVAKDLHLTLGSIFYVLLGAHVAGALWEHMQGRDTLMRMLGRQRAVAVAEAGAVVASTAGPTTTDDPPRFPTSMRARGPAAPRAEAPLRAAPSTRKRTPETHHDVV